MSIERSDRFRDRPTQRQVARLVLEESDEGEMTPREIANEMIRQGYPGDDPDGLAISLRSMMSNENRIFQMGSRPGYWTSFKDVL